MDNLTKNQVVQLAEKHSMDVVHTPDGNLKIANDDWDEGFKSTENYKKEYGGWKYFGEVSNQAKYLPLWNDLMQPPVMDEPLTPELAQSLIDKEVNVYYIGNNGHKYEMTIKPLEIGSKESNQIGQDEEFTLKFNMIKDSLNDEVDKNEVRDFMYEWQGSFRVTGSAHIIFVNRTAKN